MTNLKSTFRKLIAGRVSSNNEAGLSRQVHKYFQDDLFLAEFPKSGVTWLSTIIANLEIQSSNYDEMGSAHAKNVGFGVLPSFISDDSLATPLSLYKSKLLGGRIIKTHSPWLSRHGRVIYLYRHPAYVMSSYWSMLRAYNQIDHTISLLAFCRDENRGLSAWKNHIKSYLYSSSPASTIAFLSYEEMIQDPIKSVSRIISLFTARDCASQLRSAINFSSREYMALAEESAIANDLRYQVRFSKDYTFVGKSLRSDKAVESILPLVSAKCEKELSFLYGSKNQPDNTI